VRRGLDQLAWLMKRELAPGHLRVTPNTGVQRSGWRHGVTNLYDQQPIEVAALAEACARAWRLTGDEKWRRGIEAAYEWFLGRNDGQVPMFDPATGGAFDGLTAHGPNRNQGAESTLAMLATFQTASFIPQPTHGTH